MNATKKLLTLIAFAGLPLMPGIPLVLADEADIGKPVHCLRVDQLEDSEILDDQHIVFETNGHKYYLNKLPHPCPGMRKDTALMYRTTTDELCDLDIITVLDEYGFGLQPGASCGLGAFEPVDEAQIATLRNQIRTDRKARH